MISSPTARRRWWLVAVALLAVSLAGFAHVISLNSHGASPGAGEPAAAPETYKQVVAFGYVIPEGDVRKLHPLQPGRVAEVLVREGQPVAAGTPLLRVEDRLGRHRLEEARAGLDAARVELEEGRSKLDAHKLLIDQQKLKIEGAKQRVEVLRKVLEKKRELQSKVGGVSAIEIETTEGEVRGAELAVQAEELTLRGLQLQHPLTVVRLLEFKVAAASARVELAKVAVEETTLTAPVAGTVLRITVGVGDALSPAPQQPAIQFCPDGPRVIRAEVEQAFAAHVAEGQIVRIEDDTHAPGTWNGRVTHVSDWYAHQRSLGLDPMQPRDVRTLECLIALDPGQPKPRIGQRVRAFIQVGK